LAPWRLTQAQGDSAPDPVISTLAPCDARGNSGPPDPVRKPGAHPVSGRQREVIHTGPSVRGFFTDEDTVMEAEPTPAVNEVTLSAARKLTNFRLCQFQAEMVLRYCGGRPRRGREAVRTGLGGFRTGIRCLVTFADRDGPHARGCRGVDLLLG
jgi:hypothetical protein